MNHRHRAWMLPGALVLLGFAMAIAALLLQRSQGSDDLFTSVYFFLILVAPFLVMGALVIAHLPRHPIGWLLLLIGWSTALNLLTDAYGKFDAGSLPLAREVNAFSEVIWTPGLVILVTLLPLLFPTGSPPSPRWRWAGWLAVAGMGLLIVGGTAAIWSEDIDGVTNEATREAPAIVAPFLILVLVLLVASSAASIASMIVRFRRARGIERQQLKWFVFAVAVIFLLILYQFAPDPIYVGVIDRIVGTAILTLPLAIGIAILRYRLYEIDRLINRALVYGALSVLLIGAYVVLVVALQALLEPLTSGSDLAVAGSTLVVAALFRPVRSRVQHTVDRRFYRRKYDAVRTVDAFAARLRDEIDLDALTGELRGVVQETVQPAHMSLWLRPPQRDA